MIYAPWNEFCMIWVFWHLSGGFSRALLSLSRPSDQDLSWKGYPHPKIEKNKCVLKWLSCKSQCFKPMFFLFLFFLSEKSPSDIYVHATFERKRHCSVNRAFSAPLVRCSIAPVLLSLCRVAQLCRVARLCRLAQFVQYLCTRDIEQRTVTQSWQYLCTGDIEQRTVTQSWQ